MALADSFWSYVDNHRAGECWPWLRARSGGYGQLQFAGRVQKAHRVAYQLAVGPLRSDLVVMHTCDNPPCCNPAHLVLGTRIDNNRDRVSKGRSATGDRHGTRTHPGLWRGERNGRARLTEAQVRAIRLTTSSVSQLARDYGVSRRAIAGVISRRKWGWLP